MRNNNGYDSPFAQWLRMRMAELNIGVSDLALALRCSIGTVSFWRRGHSLPSGPFVERLAAALNVSERVIRSRMGRDVETPRQ